jgi:hypothetical protein
MDKIMNIIRGNPKFDNALIKFYEEYDIKENGTFYLCRDFSFYVAETYECVECSDLTGCMYCPFAEKYVDNIESYLMEHKLRVLEL